MDVIYSCLFMIKILKLPSRRYTCSGGKKRLFSSCRYFISTTCISVQSTLYSNQHLQTLVTVHWGCTGSQCPLSGISWRGMAGPSQGSALSISEYICFSFAAFSWAPGSTFRREVWLILSRHPRGGVQQAAGPAGGLSHPDYPPPL